MNGINFGCKKVPVELLLREAAAEFGTTLSIDDKRVALEEARKIKARKAKLLDRHCVVCGVVLKSFQKRFCSKACWLKVVQKGRCGQLCRRNVKHKKVGKK